MSAVHTSKVLRVRLYYTGLSIPINSPPLVIHGWIVPKRYVIQSVIAAWSRAFGSYLVS